MLRKLSVIILIACGPTSHSQDTTSINDWKWEVDAGLPFVAWQPYQFSDGVPQFFLAEGKYKLNDQWRARIGLIGGQGNYEPYQDREWAILTLFAVDAGVEGIVWKSQRLEFLYYGSFTYTYNHNNVGPHSSGGHEGFKDGSSFVGISGGVSIQYAITPRFVLSTELGIGYGAFIYNDYDAVCNCNKPTTTWDIFPSRWPSVMAGYRF